MTSLVKVGIEEIGVRSGGVDFTIYEYTIDLLLLLLLSPPALPPGGPAAPVKRGRWATVNHTLYTVYDVCVAMRR